jgi:hypothetical protein
LSVAGTAWPHPPRLAELRLAVERLDVVGQRAVPLGEREPGVERALGHRRVAERLLLHVHVRPRALAPRPA